MDRFLELKRILEQLKQGVPSEIQLQIEKTVRAAVGKFTAGDIAGALEAASQGLDYLDKFVKGNAEAQEKVAAMRAGIEEIQEELSRKFGGTEKDNPEERHSERPIVESGINVRILGEEIKFGESFNLLEGLGRTLQNVASMSSGPRGRSIIPPGGSIPRGRGTQTARGAQWRKEPFGHQVDKAPRRDVKDQGAREPDTDVMEEDDQIIVIAEMPGVEEVDVSYSIKGNKLLISTNESARRQYVKEVVLPAEVDSGNISVNFKNGVLEVKLTKKPPV